MEDTYKERSDLGKMAEDYFKDKDSWDRCDAARIGGYSSNDPLPDYSHYSDEELIRKYIEDKKNEDYWADDRR